MQVDVTTVMRLLAGKSLIEADRTLDAARRIVWTVQFIGGTWEQAAGEHAPDDGAALDIARCFEGVPLTVANTVLEDVRFACWMGRCQSIASSRYARQKAERDAFLAVQAEGGVQ